MALTYKLSVTPSCNSSSFFLNRHPKFFKPIHSLPSFSSQPSKCNGISTIIHYGVHNFSRLVRITLPSLLSNLKTRRRIFQSAFLSNNVASHSPRFSENSALKNISRRTISLRNISQSNEDDSKRNNNFAVEANDSQHANASCAPYSTQEARDSIENDVTCNEALTVKKIKSRTVHFDQTSPHIPVLLQEVVQSFEGCVLKNFIDCTVGAGGHAVSIISNHPEIENFVAMDVDPVAHAESSKKIKSALDSVNLRNQNQNRNDSSHSTAQLFSILENFKNLAGVLPRVNLEAGQINGIIMDIGVSSMQIDVAERGFSFMKKGKLDMRMNPNLSLTAEDIVNEWSEMEIGKILREYGEERRWKYLAQKIVQERTRGRISTTEQLTQIIGGYKGKSAGIHPSTRTFQALRIAINDELNVLETIIPVAIDTLSPGGRLAIITFHSLEDRIVKQTFSKYEKMEREMVMEELDDNSEFRFREDRNLGFSKYREKTFKLKNGGLDKSGGIDSNIVIEGKKAAKAWSGDHEWKKKKNNKDRGVVKILTKKPIVASEEEMKFNPRSRSAKLRVIEKF